MASKKTAPSGEKKTTTRKAPAKSTAKTETAPAAGAGDPDATVVAQTAKATTKENPASTTSAADPNRDSTVPETNTATAQVAAAAGAGSGETDANKAESEASAAGERVSHPAETTAERNLRRAGSSGTVDEMPAGEDADPAKNQSPTEEDLADTGSRHDESGNLQRATRDAIGAGYGAPDGIGAPAVDSPAEVTEQEEVEPAEAPNGIVYRGNKAKLFRMVQKGATHQELIEATGYTSAIGTIHVMAAEAGLGLEIEKGKDGTKTYKFAKET